MKWYRDLRNKEKALVCALVAVILFEGEMLGFQFLPRVLMYPSVVLLLFFGTILIHRE